MVDDDLGPGRTPSAGATPDLARHLLALARRPDSPLGGTSRDAFPELAPVLLEALSDAADPEQAARLLATFFARVPTPSVYARMLATDPWVARRMASLFGASAFLGEAVAFHPELADGVIFSRGTPDPQRARVAVEVELATLTEEDRRDPDAFVGALRRAKAQVLIEVGLADLAGELHTRDCTLTLSALADAMLEAAFGFAAQEKSGGAVALAVIAMGKLGGREIGYGSDLDLFFVYRDDDPTSDDAFERAVRRAQRVLRLLSAPHGEGPGYELDTRLRPSGNHGLLVVSREAFARYHGLPRERRRPRRHDERGAGPGLGAAGAPQGALHRRRRGARRGGHGARPPRGVRGGRAPRGEDASHPPTDGARARGGAAGRGAGALRPEAGVRRPRRRRVRGAVAPDEARRGQSRPDDRHRARPPRARGRGLPRARAGRGAARGVPLLRRLEQRLRVLHGTSAQWIEEGAPGVAPLARRMGMRDGPWGSAAEALLVRYRAVTEDVRAAYLAVIGAA